jgi:hypothetical protein
VKLDRERWSDNEARASLGCRVVDALHTAMYIHHMVRTQLYLDEEIHKRLREVAERQGRTVSDLVREAVARVYGPSTSDRRLATLDRITALWQDRDELGDTNAYVRRLRRNTRPDRDQS